MLIPQDPSASSEDEGPKSVPMQAARTPKVKRPVRDGTSERKQKSRRRLNASPNDRHNVDTLSSQGQSRGECELLQPSGARGSVDGESALDEIAVAWMCNHSIS